MQRFLIIAVVILVFLAYVVTYTVRFTERAVVTTFGKADAASVVSEGLRLKIPYVQQVTRYDMRARFLETTQETQQTFDSRGILVTAYMTWSVGDGPEDPLKFYRRFSHSGDTARDHYRAAELLLRSNLRSALSEISKFRLDELLSADPKSAKLAQLEKNILDRLSHSGEAASALSEYGIKPITVGISGIGLPQDTTRVVFDAMRANRTKIANAAIDQGTSQAQTILSTANSNARRITLFAELLSKRIRAQGDIEAAEFLKQMNTEPDLAVFLQNMEFFKESFARNTTLVFPTSMPGFELARPDASKNFKNGLLPGPKLTDLPSLEKALKEIASTPADASAPPASPLHAGPDAVGGENK